MNHERRNRGSTVLDLFAGPGGTDEGLRLAGLDDVIGLEVDEDACATAVAAGHKRDQCDVEATDPSTYAGIAGLVASPPCQDFSSSGRSAVAGTAHLVHEPERWIDALRPEWVMLEQVRLVQPIWRAMSLTLVRWGYTVWTGLVDAADYGVPQHRIRAVLLASRVGPVEFPMPTHAGGGLFGERHRAAASVVPGLTNDGWIDRRQNGAPLYTASRPAPTVTGAQSQWVLYDESMKRLRCASNEDSAAWQAFREDYPWQGTSRSIAQQVANAVPPPMAAALVAASARKQPLHDAGDDL